MNVELFAVALKQLEVVEESLYFAYSTIITDEGCEDLPIEIEIAINAIKDIVNSEIRDYSAQ